MNFPSEFWLWLAVAGLGLFHGINPAMGWLFAAALGLNRRSERVVWLALLPIGLGHALAVAIISYNGGIDFGLLGDYDAMPDLTQFAAYLDEARQELVDLAQATASNGRGTSTPERTSRPRTSSPASTEA